MFHIQLRALLSHGMASWILLRKTKITMKVISKTRNHSQLYRMRLALKWVRGSVMELISSLILIKAIEVAKVKNHQRLQALAERHVL
jgi:hypothetical protein